MNVRHNFLNLSSLAAIQFGNAILPLIFFPYVLLTIGAEEFSKVVTAEALAFIVLTFALYSFDISGVKKVLDAVAEYNPSELKNVFFTILYSRLLVFSICAAIVGFLIWIVNAEVFVTYIFWLPFPLGVVLQSSYFFQANSTNHILAVFVLLPRLIVSIVGFLMVENSTISSIIALLLALSFLATGVLVVIYISAQNGFLWPWSLRRKIYGALKEGFALFIAGASVILYRGSNILILSFFSAGAEAISIYAVSEKYIRMMQASTLPLNQFFAVKLVRGICDRCNEYLGWSFFWSNIKYQFFLALLLVTGYFFTKYCAINWFNIDFFSRLDSTMSIMVFAIIFGVFNYMFGGVTHNALGLDKAYAKIVLVVGLSTVLLTSLLVKEYASVGAAFGFLFGEILLTALLLFYLRDMFFRGTFYK